MSVEAFTWALRVPVGSNQKVVLLGLANHAHPDGTEAYPALDTLASYAHCDRSTARRNVQKLVEAGWIREDGLGPRGQKKYALAMGDPFTGGGSEMPPGGKTQPVAPAPAGGGILPLEGVAPVPPEPSFEPNVEPTSGEERASAHDLRDQVPEDFPVELKPHARQVMVILRQIAADHGAKKVWAKALAVTMMNHPGRRYVAVAGELQAWAVDPKRPIKDVVATYRTFLARSEVIEGIERLTEHGQPEPSFSVSAAARGPLGRGRLSNADQVQANIEALRGGPRSLHG